MNGGDGRLEMILLTGGPTLTETAWNTVDAAEYSGGFRIDARSGSTGTAHFVTVLGIDGAVTSAGLAGGTVTVDGARAITVTFPDDGGPPSVTVAGRSVTLRNDVDPQPLLRP
jgi:hypothetical protein